MDWKKKEKKASAETRRKAEKTAWKAKEITEEEIDEEYEEEEVKVPESRFARRQMINPIEQQELEEKKRLEEEEKAKSSQKIKTIQVTFNGEPVSLTGKAEYVFVDIFDFVAFNLKNIPGKRIVTQLNGQNALYMNPLYNGDSIEVFWEEI